MGFRGKGKGKGYRNNRRPHQHEGEDSTDWRTPVEQATEEEIPIPRSESPKSPRHGRRHQPHHQKRKPSSNEQVQTEDSSIHANRIVNGNLALPWTPNPLDSATQKILESMGPESTSTTWVPMVDVSVQPTNSSVYTGSYFGGNKALVREGSQWPICLGCREPMLVIGQVDRSSLLHPYQGTGLVQVFACVRCVTPRPTSNVWANVVDLADTSVEYQVKEYVNPQAPTPKLKRIVKWLPRKDFIHPEELETISGKHLGIDEWRALGKAQVRGDKVGGFAPWLPSQFKETIRPKLRCRTCDKSLRMLFQVDSNDNVGFQWGPEDGYLAVFECQFHPQQVVGIMIT